jgi:hypothetical protein
MKGMQTVIWRVDLCAQMSYFQNYSFMENDAPDYAMSRWHDIQIRLWKTFKDEA